nr:unnamed protein product [Callosobruchus chinensis]
MHKITKGLKKKKKTKKSKKREDDLFKPEELEKYRREHEQQLQQAAESGEPQPQNEEWKKFLALTSGVDDILKKTQGDLDRIRSTSFFQRKPTEVEVQQAEQEHLRQQQIAVKEAQREAAEAQGTSEEVNPCDLGIVEVSESESEEEEDDGIFDTAYIEAVEAGELKLANIPESPTDLVPSGTDGDDPFDTSIADRAILGPQVSIKGKRLVPLGAAVEVLTGRVELPTCATKRPISQKRQVFKERDLLLGSFDQDTTATRVEGAVSYEEPKKTVLDEDIDLPDIPIDLSKPIQLPPQPPVKEEPKEGKDAHNNILEEFDLIAKKEEDDDDVEFELLAVESIKKPDNVVKSIPPVINNLPVAEVLPDNAKWNAFDSEPANEEVDAEDIDDPFDTTFAAKVIPFEENRPKEVNLFNTEARIQESDLNFIKPEDRDLLGGSQIDLSSAVNITQTVEEDDDFDPRAEEKQRERSVSRPEVLNITGGSKTVSFDIPSPEGVVFDGKAIKPLTPFYAPPEEDQQNGLDFEVDDPFDTSRITDLQPGRAELKCIESELLDPEAEKKLSLVIEESTRPRKPSIVEAVSTAVDLLAIDNDISVKVLTPGESIEELAYSDPFDTSIASNILPGKTELKLLESELIFSQRVCKSMEMQLEWLGNLAMPIFYPKYAGRSDTSYLMHFFIVTYCVPDQPLTK